MKTALFDFHLPDSLIALEPVEPRDSARMLVVEPPALRDDEVKNLPDYLQAGDVLVLNNTKVIPARLRVKRGEAKVELLLHQHEGDGRWSAFAKPAKRLKVGEYVHCMNDRQIAIVNKYDDGQVGIDFGLPHQQVLALLHEIGEMPLPPYIEKNRKANQQDEDRYQTVFADQQKSGSVAAPTAGLHFTDALLDAIRVRGVKVVYVTLNVGAGTFLPVKVDDIENHQMHAEFAEITPEVADIINNAKACGGRVIAVGTTSVRTLESAAENGRVKAFQQETRIFINPGFQFQIVDMLLTNFHLPKSTLFMLVSAFSGRETMLAAYQHAIDEQYRFYSYGDACLLYRATTE